MRATLVGSEGSWELWNKIKGNTGRRKRKARVKDRTEGHGKKERYAAESLGTRRYTRHVQYLFKSSYMARL